MVTNGQHQDDRGGDGGPARGGRLRPGARDRVRRQPGTQPDGAAHGAGQCAAVADAPGCPRLPGRGLPGRPGVRRPPGTLRRDVRRRPARRPALLRRTLNHLPGRDARLRPRGGRVRGPGDVRGRGHRALRGPRQPRRRRPPAPADGNDVSSRVRRRSDGADGVRRGGHPDQRLLRSHGPGRAEGAVGLRGERPPPGGRRARRVVTAAPAVRTVSAWAFAFLAVAGAVALARTASGTGVFLGVDEVIARPAGALDALGGVLPLGYAFAAGMLAAVNPCGFALLPGYLGLYLGEREAVASRAGRLGRAL